MGGGSGGAVLGKNWLFSRLVATLKSEIATTKWRDQT